MAGMAAQMAAGVGMAGVEPRIDGHAGVVALPRIGARILRGLTAIHCSVSRDVYIPAVPRISDSPLVRDCTGVLVHLRIRTPGRRRGVVGAAENKEGEADKGNGQIRLH